MTLRWEKEALEQGLKDLGNSFKPKKKKTKARKNQERNQKGKSE
ncbi:hypothetical protein [Helicobacter pylori]|nr:hypothetical protein [Helicobacter pylori]